MAGRLRYWESLGGGFNRRRTRDVRYGLRGRRAGATGARVIINSVPKSALRQRMRAAREGRVKGSSMSRSMPSRLRVDISRCKARYWRLN